MGGPVSRDAYNRYSREWARRNRVRVNGYKRAHRERMRALVAKIKSESGCADCGITDPVVLDFHHLGDKRDNVSTIISRNDEPALRAEIAKCIVLCANCHRRRGVVKLESQMAHTHQLPFESAPAPN